MRSSLGWLTAVALGSALASCAGSSGNSGGGAGGMGGSAGSGGGAADLDGVWIGSTQAAGVDVGVLLDLARDGGLRGHIWLEIFGDECDTDLTNAIDAGAGFTASMPEVTDGNLTCRSALLTGTLIAASQTMQLKLSSSDASFSLSLQRLGRVRPGVLTPLVVNQVNAVQEPKIDDAVQLGSGLRAVATKNGPGVLDFGNSSWDLPESALLFVDATSNEVVEKFEISLSDGKLFRFNAPVPGPNGKVLVSAGASSTGDYTIASSTASRTLSASAGQGEILAQVSGDGSIDWATIATALEQFVWRPKQSDYLAVDDAAQTLVRIDGAGNVTPFATLPDEGNLVLVVDANGAPTLFSQASAYAAAVARFDVDGTQLSFSELDNGVSSMAAAVALPDGAIVVTGHASDERIGTMKLFRLEADDSVGWEMRIDGGYYLSVQEGGSDVLLIGQRRLPFTRWGNDVVLFEDNRYLARVDGFSGTTLDLCLMPDASSPINAVVQAGGELFISTSGSLGTYTACAQ